MIAEKSITGTITGNQFKTFEDELYARVGKKFFEMFLLLLLVVPIIILVPILYILLLIPNKGKVIFTQNRIGMNGELFLIYKFRTLKCSIDVDIEKDTSVIRNNSHAIGFFLRKTGLDEILQIINVFKGEMNIIGPRPLLMKDMNHLSDHQFVKRHKIKPGILGLWQVRRTYSDDKNYFRYDSFYFKKQSLAIDMYIVISTVIYMIKRQGR